MCSPSPLQSDPRSLVSFDHFNTAVPCSISPGLSCLHRPASYRVTPGLHKLSCRQFIHNFDSLLNPAPSRRRLLQRTSVHSPNMEKFSQFRDKGEIILHADCMRFWQQFPSLTPPSYQALASHPFCQFPPNLPASTCPSTSSCARSACLY